MLIPIQRVGVLCLYPKQDSNLGPYDIKVYKIQEIKLYYHIYHLFSLFVFKEAQVLMI